MLHEDKHAAKIEHLTASVTMLIAMMENTRINPDWYPDEVWEYTKNTILKNMRSDDAQ